MKVDDSLADLYTGYYDVNVAEKRSISAEQTVSHMAQLLPSTSYSSLIDVGAGEGSVLAVLERLGIASELYALEISSSGVAAIKARALPTLRSVDQFDGYQIPLAGAPYSVAVAAHVLEHVEHERAFVRALINAAELVYIEVPLELTVRVERSIRASGKFGHINFYTPATLRNLLETSGAEIMAFQTFSNSLAYERFTGGTAVGTMKHLVRKAILGLAPRMATQLMTYVGAALCRKRAGSPRASGADRQQGHG